MADLASLNPQQKKELLLDAFEVEGDQLLKALATSGIINPLWAIQPVIVPKPYQMPDEDEKNINDYVLTGSIENEFVKKDGTEGTFENVSMSTECQLHADLRQFMINPEPAETDRPLYILLVSTKVEHASIMIFYDGKLYSIGLGLLGENAALYTPDYLIRPEKYTYSIIDIGFLKKSHLINLLEKCDISTYSLTSGRLPVSIYFKENIFDAFIITLGTKYSRYSLSARSIGNAIGNGINCASFASSIFNDRVRCNVGSKVPVIGPILSLISTIASPSGCKSIYIDKPDLLLKQYVDEVLQKKKIFSNRILFSLLNAPDTRQPNIVTAMNTGVNDNSESNSGSNSNSNGPYNAEEIFLERNGTKKRRSTRQNGRNPKRGGAKTKRRSKTRGRYRDVRPRP
jgi:hypothetical protein